MGSKWSRRGFLALAGAGAAGMALPRWLQAAGGSPDKLNVLFIGVDDLRCGLGCYGAEHIHSPHIDALAERGVRFERAYVQQAVCAASRASFLTGCRPDTTTVSYPYNEYFTKEFLPEHHTVPRYYHDHGYLCRGMGKLHHGPPLDMSVFPEPYFGGRRGTGNYALPANQGKKPPTECADVPDDAYKDGQLAEEAARTIHCWKDADRPWCLGLGFYKPHLPFTAPKRYWDLYNRDEIPLSPNPDLPANAPFYAAVTFELPTYDGKPGTDENPIDPGKARLLRHGYYGCTSTSFTDAQIGKVLAALVEYVDMFPTVCELTGHPTPDYLEGLSMVPLLERPNRAWKTGAFSQYERWGDKPVLMGRSIRTDRYRYTEWRRTEHAPNASGAMFRGPEGSLQNRELYDHRADPEESKNLAHVPGMKQTVQALSEKLKAGWRGAVLVLRTCNTGSRRVGFCKHPLRLGTCRCVSEVAILQWVVSDMRRKHQRHGICAPIRWSLGL